MTSSMLDSTFFYTKVKEQKIGKLDLVTEYITYCKLDCTDRKSSALTTVSAVLTGTIMQLNKYVLSYICVTNNK